MKGPGHSPIYSYFSFPCTMSLPHNQRGAPSTLSAEQGSLCSQFWGQQESQHWYTFFSTCLLTFEKDRPRLTFSGYSLGFTVYLLLLSDQNIKTWR